VSITISTRVYEGVHVVHMWTDAVNGNEPWKFFQLEVCNHSMSVRIVPQGQL